MVIKTLVTNGLQNVLFCVLKKKVSHSGLEQNADEYMMAEYFWVNFLSA